MSTPRAIDAGVGIGEIFVDKYRVDSILGYGGMGVVAMCTHLALNERVAIKMLRRDVLDDADAVERFMREAQAAVKLKSEYVARVTDVGRSRNNVPYMVMEYLEGHDLGELLDERGCLGLPWAIELTIQACEALAEAHSIGIVHRDVKPTNLFVTWRPDGSALIKVLDFGISKALTGHAMQLTQTQSLLGTPAYMSPEQMRSARMVDARTDIWSLGTVLYEMLEGRRPFEAESFSEMCVKVAVDPPGAMTTAPPELQQVVMRCLEKAPEQRYSSMAELARDLVRFSHDPHQAQVLVERMARTLRRSQVQAVEWNPANSGVSGPIRQLRGSGERDAVPAAPLDPSGSSSSSGSAIPATRVDRSSGPAAAARLDRNSGAAPAAKPDSSGDGRPGLSETLAVTRPRHRRAITIAAAVIAATALGVVISLLRTPAPVPSEPLPPPPRAPDSAAAGATAGAAGASAPTSGTTGAPTTSAAGASTPTTGAAGTSAPPRTGAPDPVPGASVPSAIRDGKPAPKPESGNRRPAGRPNRVVPPPAAGDVHTDTPQAAKQCVFDDAHGAGCADHPGASAAPDHH